jgi:hypothetical protein
VARTLAARSIALAVALALPGSAARAQRAVPGTPAPPPLSVRIEEPARGPTEGPLVTFEATVSDPTVRTATLVVGGAAYEVPVEAGRISQQLVVFPGQNRVGVVVHRRGEIARDSVTFHAASDPLDLMVVLSWPSEGEIIDLWVREPSGETCKWDHRETRSGGYLLDFSADAIGFGSQAFVLGRIAAGRYRVKVHYWGDYAHDDDREHYTFDGLIGQLDRTEERLLAAAPGDRAALSAERDRIEQRLDRWSRPAAPQTPVRAEIILFAGTSSERRWRFDLVVQHTGMLVTLGEVEVTDEMIRAARAEAGGSR